jgi:hypothetical protein
MHSISTHEDGAIPIEESEPESGMQMLWNVRENTSMRCQRLLVISGLEQDLIDALVVSNERGHGLEG